MVLSAFNAHLSMWYCLLHLNARMRSALTAVFKWLLCSFIWWCTIVNPALCWPVHKLLNDTQGFLKLIILFTNDRWVAAHFPIVNWPKEVKPTCIFLINLIQKQSYLFYRNDFLDQNFRIKFSAKKQQYLFSKCARFHFCSLIVCCGPQIWVNVPFCFLSFL